MSEFGSCASVHIYVDGTYQPKHGMGYGFVAFDSTHKAILHQESKSIENKAYLHSTNCAAELIGVIRAILWAERNGFRFVHVHHDYSGVRTLSRHRRPGHRHPLFNFFKEFIGKRVGFQGQNKMMVILHKVRGHSGNLGNEIADRLARASVRRNNVWFSLLQRWCAIARNSLPCLQVESFITHQMAGRATS